MTTPRGMQPQPAGAPAGWAAAPAAEVLRRADGLQLIGEMAGSGYREPPSLVRRADGQTLQLTPLLYLTLEAIDGERDAEQVAAAVSERSGRSVSAANIEALVTDKLRPLGLLVRADGTQPEVKRSSPLLGLRFRVAIVDPIWTRRLTQPFTVLFHPLVALPLLAAFGLVCWWVFFRKGLASATYEAFERPGLLIFVFVVTILSAGFHEFGHAAAARRGGATPGVMGAGVYLVWPAFYTDVTDAYRLGRGGRLRTDLGGLYFNAIVAVAITGAWWVTGYDALLLVVATQILQMLGQLLPLVRFDGYHVLADLTGVPDLFQRIKPTLLGLLPWRWGDLQARVLKPWARAVVTLWVVVVVPVLGWVLTMLVLTLPRILATAWAKLEREQENLSAAWNAGDLLQATASVLTMVAVAFPVLASLMVLGRVVRRVAVSVWKRTDDSWPGRAVAVLTAGLLVAGLAWAWWPDGTTYRPIRPDERGTLVDAMPAGVAGVAPARPSAGIAANLGEGNVGQLDVVWDASQPMPTRARPQLALVLVPTGAGSGSGSGSGPEQGWVFPFSKPLAPGPGDNQALALNTEDGTTQYDVAISLVWVLNGEEARNKNEAYAFASCTSCASVAVAYQVVLVVGDNHVAVPQNLAGALNSDCVNCLTYALAQQLFVTLDAPLSQVAMAALDALWAELAEFAEDIESVPLNEIDDRLDDYTAEILALIEADQPGTVPAPSPSDISTESVEPSPSPSPTPTAPSSSDPPSGVESPTAPPSTPTETPAETPAGTPTPTPTEPATGESSVTP